LATSWQEAIYRALEEPYLALQSNERLQVPVGEARYVGFGGPLGKKLTVASNDEGVALVKLEAPNRRFKAYGADVGDTALGLKAGSVAVGLAVQVRHWAASIPDSTEAALTGSGQDERIALKVAVNAALSAVEPRPGALVSVNSTERTGAVFRIGVLASGEGYFDAKKRIEVQLKWLSPPSMEPADLMVSNSPERIYSLGCLMREPLSPDRAARLLYHHVNSTGQPILFVARIANAGPEAAAAHVILAESGPGRDELGVGHAAAARFWEASRTGSGYVLRIPAMTASDIVRTPASPETVLSGLAAIAPLTASSLFVEVSALPVHDEAEWVEPLASEEYTQPKLTTFRFAAKKTTELIHEVGGAWTFFSLGREGSTNEAGTHLSGDYGVLHEINLRITNPHDEPGWAALEVRASGGLMRGLFLIDGQLHETGILAGTQQERLFRQDIPPGTTRNVRIQTIPESASNYPVHLVVHSGLTG